MNPVTWLTAILGFLTALPKILEGAEKIGKWLSGKGDPIKFLADVDKTIDELEKAATPYDKLQAAKKIRDLIRRT